MDFTLSAEESFFQRSSRAFLLRLCPPAIPRQWAYGPAALPIDLWKDLGVGGWLGITVPQRYGGSGSSSVLLGLFAMEAGRVLLPTIWRGTTFVTLAVLVAGNEAQAARFLPSLASGSIVAALALEPPSPVLRLQEASNGSTVSGVQPMVPNAGVADWLLSFAASPSQGVVGVLIPRKTRGVTLRARPALGGEPVYEVRYEDVRVDDGWILGYGIAPAERARLWEQWFDRSLAVQCMEMAGGAARVLDMTSEYVRGIL